MMAESFGVGLQLMIAGMGLVFLLLLLLWGLMAVLLRLDRAPAAEPALAADGPGAAAPRAAVAPEELDPETVAAISVAVLLHRSIRRKQAAPAMRAHRPGSLPSRWLAAGRARQNQNWQPRRR